MTVAPPTEPILTLPDDAATDRLGTALAGLLRTGDTLLLRGPIGAGKTHLARALIRARTGAAIDVPSPSFTLIQTYDSPAGPICHADLYRLTGPDDVIELGLLDAFGSALCLVEWPDRLGDLAPSDAMTLTLAVQGDGRQVRLEGRPETIAAVRGAMA